MPWSPEFPSLERGQETQEKNAAETQRLSSETEEGQRFLGLTERGKSNDIAHFRGSSTGGVLLWVLAILTIDGTGEDHQQEKWEETKTNNWRRKTSTSGFNKPQCSARRKKTMMMKNKLFTTTKEKSTITLRPLTKSSPLANKQTLIHRDCHFARLWN